MICSPSGARIGGSRLFIYGAATRHLEGAMAELGLMAEAGAVGFANGTQTVMDSMVMRRLLSYCGMLDRPFVQYEDMRRPAPAR